MPLMTMNDPTDRNNNASPTPMDANNNSGSRCSSRRSSGCSVNGERRPSAGILKERRPSTPRKRLSVTFDADQAPLQTPPTPAKWPSENLPYSERLAEILQEFDEKENISKLTPEEISDCLLAAIHKDDAEEVERIFDTEDMDIDLANSCSETGLFLAVCYGRVDIARRLLRRRADVNVADQHGNTPLHEAVQLADEDMVELLLKEGRNTNVNAKNQRGETPLHVAAEYDYVTIASKLIERGASPNVKNKDGRSPFLSALDDGSCSVCRLLLQLPPKYALNMQLVDNDRNTALLLAVRSPYLKDVTIVEQIVLKGYRFDNDISWLENAREPNKFRHQPYLWKRILEESRKDALDSP